MDEKKILLDTINSFEEGDRFVTDSKQVKYIREDIVLQAIINVVRGRKALEKLPV